jgi:PTS system galactitol-specific IIC component
MAYIVTDMSGSAVAAWVLACIWIVLELKSADLTEKQVQHLTGIPGVSCPHLILLDNILLAPVSRLLDIIPGFNKFKLGHSQSKDWVIPHEVARLHDFA